MEDVTHLGGGESGKKTYIDFQTTLEFTLSQMRDSVVEGASPLTLMAPDVFLLE